MTTRHLSRTRAILSLGLLALLGYAGERPANAGAPQGVLAACPPSPNCVSSQAGDGTHRIEPLPTGGNADGAFARLKALLSQRDDTAIIAEGPGYLRVEFRTLLFVDDGEFLVDVRRQVIHVRSASRLGYWDLGKNRRRMEDIRRAFTGGGR